MSEETLNIMVATDLHYLSKSINDGGEAFCNVMSKGDGKVMTYIEEIVDAFVLEVIKRKPDALILLGDLTFNSERISHIELAAKLDNIVGAGVPVYLIPGNHDINHERCMGFRGNEVYKVESVSQKEFQEIYCHCGYDRAEYFDKSSASYVAKLSESLYVIMLDTNSYSQNYLCDEAFIWLENVLKEISKPDVHILGVSHQNLLEHNFMFTEGFMIKNAQKIEELYKKYNVKLNLSGHMHIQHIEDRGVAEIVTSSLAVAPNHFANIVYDGKSFKYFTQSLEVEAVEGFKSISRHEFDGVGERQLVRLFKTHGFEDVSEPDIDKMGKTFVKMNEKYFAGEIFDADEFEEGIKLWEEQPESFTSVYIKSILESVCKDQNIFEVKL
ncbi:metallophosphoesterase [Lachnoanaerobaculum saburreum]|uniref:Ser/Thr phosphatase family protein n=1 Tax=Lachnoanaerobaculum saburreum TaxID=467210 RepID=A0A133ZRS0_9FIRM|nr:metallophosphoesterase [Lachnoanaerobaculum saburreum]KXB58135.1 Ser/Thr phosphatase family protein [Lachnoanaerobaculum saburreum]